MEMREREERGRKSQYFDYVWKVISEIASGIYKKIKIEPNMFHERTSIISENVIERG